MMASKGWKVVQQHIPMIRFRNGGSIKGTGATTAQSVAPGASAQLGGIGATGPGVTPLPTIEDYQLPLRYKRRLIDDKEIAYINRGGPE